MLAGQAQQAPGVAEDQGGMVAAVAGGYTEHNLYPLHRGEEVKDLGFDRC